MSVGDESPIVAMAAFFMIGSVAAAIVQGSWVPIGICFAGLILLNVVFRPLG